MLPAYRGHHLLERMTERLSEEAPKHGLEGIYAEPLTIHTFSQRNDERAGMPVCAVLLGANPESFRPKDVPCPTAGQRQSYLRTFRFVQQPAARTIHAPAPYREMLLKIYASLGVTVSVAAPAGADCPGVAYWHQGERSRLRRDPFRWDRPGSHHRASTGTARRAGARRQFGATLRIGRRSRSSAPDGRGPRVSASSSAAWDRPSRTARIPCCFSG